MSAEERKARIARNPRTGEPAPVPQRKVPVFKVSKELKDLVASQGVVEEVGGRLRLAEHVDAVGLRDVEDLLHHPEVVVARDRPEVRRPRLDDRLEDAGVAGPDRDGAGAVVLASRSAHGALQLSGLEPLVLERAAPRDEEALGRCGKPRAGLAEALAHLGLVEQFEDRGGHRVRGQEVVPVLVGEARVGDARGEGPRQLRDGADVVGGGIAVGFTGLSHQVGDVHAGGALAAQRENRVHQRSGCIDHVVDDLEAVMHGGGADLHRAGRQAVVQYAQGLFSRFSTDDRQAYTRLLGLLETGARC